MEVEKMKVAELRAELKRLGQDTSGLKAVLVKRLKSVLDAANDKKEEDEVAEEVEAGKEEIEEAQDKEEKDEGVDAKETGSEVDKVDGDDEKKIGEGEDDGREAKKRRVDEIVTEGEAVKKVELEEEKAVLKEEDTAVCVGGDGNIAGGDEAVKNENVGLEEVKGAVMEVGGNEYPADIEVSRIACSHLQPEEVKRCVSWLLGHYGTVIQVSLVYDAEGRFGDSAVVTMGSRAAAFEAATALNEQYKMEGAENTWLVKVKEEPSQVQVPRMDVGGAVDEGGAIFVSGFPPYATQADVFQVFNNYGTVLEADLFMDRNTGLVRGFGIVRFKERASAECAMAALNSSPYTMPGGVPLRCKWDEKHGRSQNFHNPAPGAHMAGMMPYSGPAAASMGAPAQPGVQGERGFYGQDVPGLPPSATVDEKYAHLYQQQ